MMTSHLFQHRILPGQKIGNDEMENVFYLDVKYPILNLGISKIIL